MHPRTLIRERIVARLMNATAAGDRVYDSRSRETLPENFPLINVISKRDTVETLIAAPRRYGADCTVQIEVWAVPMSPQQSLVAFGGVPEPRSAARIVDDIVEQIEALLDSDRYLRDPSTLEAAAAEARQTAIETDVGHENRTALAAARVTWEFRYDRKEAAQPIGGVVDLLLTHVEWQFPGNNAVPEAVDDIPSNS